MIDQVKHVDPTADSDSVGTTAKSVRWPTTLAEQLEEYGDQRGRGFSWACRKAAIEMLDREEANAARLDRPDGPAVFDTLGPFDGGEYLLLVDGVVVPYVKAYKVTEEHGGPGWTLTCDAEGAGGYQTGVLSQGEMWTQACFWAHAMAVSAGYTSHGMNSHRRNPHGLGIKLEDWARDGWAIADASGASGSGYEVTVRFLLPNVTDSDQVAYDIRDAIVRAASERGGRAVAADMHAIAPLEVDRRTPGWHVTSSSPFIQTEQTTFGGSAFPPAGSASLDG